MDLEPKSAILKPMKLGFPYRGGPCRPERTRFSSPVCLIVRDEFSDPWTGDEIFSSLGGAGNQKSAGRWGSGFSHCAGRYESWC